MVTKGYRKGVYRRVTFETALAGEAMGLRRETGDRRSQKLGRRALSYARAASKKKRKISKTGWGSQRMIFHTMKLIA
jgi:hypothetical protein